MRGTEWHVVVKEYEVCVYEGFWVASSVKVLLVEQSLYSGTCGCM